VLTDLRAERYVEFVEVSRINTGKRSETFGSDRIDKVELKVS